MAFLKMSGIAAPRTCAPAALENVGLGDGEVVEGRDVAVPVVLHPLWWRSEGGGGSKGTEWLGVRIPADASRWLRCGWWVVERNQVLQ